MRTTKLRGRILQLMTKPLRHFHASKPFAAGSTSFAVYTPASASNFLESLFKGTLVLI
jgi:hypothetical protein